MVYLAMHEPERLDDALKDPDPGVLAEAVGVDGERWWSFDGSG